MKCKANSILSNQCLKLIGRETYGFPYDPFPGGNLRFPSQPSLKMLPLMLPRILRLKGGLGREP